MTSVRKREANRRNAQKSTGPKTEDGLRRSSRNARTHGLNIPIYRDPALGAEAEALTDSLAAGGENRNVRACAAQVARSQITLERVMAAELKTIDKAQESIGEAREGAGFAAVIAAELDRMAESAIRTLQSITRYEKRARSKLKSDVRDFERCIRENNGDVLVGETKPKR